MIDFKALGAQAVKTGADMTKAQAGGGDYTPPAAGPCRLRLVGYVEIGKHEKQYKGVPKVENQVELVFEVSGPKHPASDVDGKKVPIRLTETMSLSLNEKANFFKLFQRMNYAGDAQHMIQLLGRPFLGTVVHDKWTGKDGKERISAGLRGPDGYTIRPPRVEDLDTGEWKTVEVAPALSPLRGFLWDHADAEQWGSLFIEGEYPARTNDKGEITAPAKSKNVFQNKIRSALNFGGSAIAEILAAHGVGALALPTAEETQEDAAAPEATQAPAAKTNAATAPVDPLAGVA